MGEDIGLLADCGGEARALRGVPSGGVSGDESGSTGMEGQAEPHAQVEVQDHVGNQDLRQAYSLLFWVCWYSGFFSLFVRVLVMLRFSFGWWKTGGKHRKAGILKF